MTVDPHSADRKTQTHVDIHTDDDKHLLKSWRLSRLTSLAYPIILTLLLIIGTVLLVLLLTQRNTCRQLQAERIEGLPAELQATWVPCIKTSKSSLCACPASFVHSTINPSHCIPTHSRCLHSCKTNPHCACHNLLDAPRCHEITRDWIEKEYQIGPIQHLHNFINKNHLQHSWTDHSNYLVEHLLVDTHAGERLFFSADRKTAVTIQEQQDDYLLNERWTKIETNTTDEHIIYSQIDSQTNTCQLALVYHNGTVMYGSSHVCPGLSAGAPYYLGAACQDILVLWHGVRQSKIRRQDGWAITHHNFESAIPRLPVLLDPFHRYYSLYEDSMIEIKDLNGDVLAQLFTDIEKATKFEFIDAYGTILIGNRTHMQLLSSTNKETWLDI